jgi:hypothetical protein
MSGERTPNERIGDIIRSAAANEQAAANILSPDDMKALADRVDLLTADIGRWESYKAASAEYVLAFKTEVDWHNRIRLAVSVACGLLVIFLLAMLMVGVRNANDFKPEHSHALTALIVGCITGSVVVTIAVVKGAFSNVADRNAGLPMPEHMKEIVDAAKGIMGGLGKS